MSDYQYTTLFGNPVPAGEINAQTLNPNSATPDDWLRVMTDGIQNDVRAGITGMLNGAVADGQLPQNANGNDMHAQQPVNWLPLVIVGAIIYAVLK